MAFFHYILSFSRVTFNPPLHLTLTTLLAISLAKLRFFLGIELHVAVLKVTGRFRVELNADRRICEVQNRGGSFRLGDQGGPFLLRRRYDSGKGAADKADDKIISLNQKMPKR